jgi:competence protein ComEC
VLVDTGPPDGPIVERLRAAGVRELDLLVLTHGQADHEGAAPRILDRVPVRAILDGAVTAPAAGDGGRIVQAAIASNGARHLLPAAGQTLRVGRIELRVLWPPGDAEGGRAAADPAAPVDDPNQRAIVLLARDGPLDVLLTADAESPVTAPLDLPQVDVLKVAHHGSADPGLPALLERLRPRLAAIEVGRDNSYGHPDPTTLRALAAAGAQVVRTDRDGTVRVSLDGERLEVDADG